MNHSHMKSVLIGFAAVVALGGCANAGVGISIPIGPFGSIGLGVNAAGQITGNVGVGTSVGGVGVGGGTSFPLGTVGAPPPTSANPQSGSSQQVPR